MALSQNVIRELRRELATLQRSREEIDARTSAIQKILTSEHTNNPLPHHARSTRIPNTPHKTKRRKSVIEATSLLQVETIGQSPRKAKKDLTQALHNKGVSVPPGRTSLSEQPASHQGLADICEEIGPAY